VELETKLIDDLLDVSRIRAGTLSLDLHPVGIATALAEAIELCRPLIEAKALEVTVEPNGEGVVRADPPRLRQILWNVLKNAAKFTPRGGSIAIHSRVTDDRVVVTVTDSGIGITRDALAHVFDAFEQADPHITQQFGGLGLGLAISRSLAELHGGTLTAESQGPDLGATFTLALPRLGVPLTAPAPVEMTSHPRVLVVDDHDDTADIIATLLEVKGYQVAIAHNVADALAQVTTEEFDLLLSDIGLPDASGYDLMRQVREQHAIKGIAMSGWGRDEDIARGRAAGFSEHLVKPLDLGVLMSAIQRVLHT
ncbi:MAG: response regulator, partial [Deltaproteobacteria bacterium]|nr:response regulator [Deltaproteobacteria bacterium]